MGHIIRSVNPDGGRFYSRTRTKRYRYPAVPGTYRTGRRSLPPMRRTHDRLMTFWTGILVILDVVSFRCQYRCSYQVPVCPSIRVKQVGRGTIIASFENRSTRVKKTIRMGHTVKYTTSVADLGAAWKSFPAAKTASSRTTSTW